MPDEFSVSMKDLGGSAHVVVTGEVTGEEVWRIWRTVEAAFAMYSSIDVDLSMASVDQTVVSQLLDVRDRLAGQERTLSIVGLAA